MSIPQGKAATASSGSKSTPILPSNRPTHSPGSPPGGRFQPKDILPPGPDRRTYVFDTIYNPACAVCSLVLDMPGGVQFGGTGFLIGRRTLVTAGHVLDDPQRGIAFRATVVPGRRLILGPPPRVDAPFGEASQIGPDCFRISPRWANGKDTNFDYAAILLPQNIVFQDRYGLVAPVPYYSADDSVLLNKLVYNYGYPSNPIPNNAEGNAMIAAIGGEPPEMSTMWMNAGPVTDSTDYRLFYDLDTSEGQSGSPILYWDNGDKRYYAVGIHTEGRVSVNGAVRVTDDLFAQFRAWRQENNDEQ